ncbi:MAG TPA: NAD(P)H-dependent oxidoreductase [Cellvibrionaceae bacterium]
MSKQILRVDSSVFNAQGQSTRLNDLVIEGLVARWPGSTVVQRNLALLPHLDGSFFAALGTEAANRTVEQKHQVAVADAIIAEVQSADVLVLAAPMYNFSIPSQVKSWMDYLARAGSTFRYTAQGPEGLIANKPVFVQTTRGGVHQGSARDTIVPLLTHYFGLLGITDVRFTFAEGLNQPDLKEAGWQNAVAQLSQNLAA